MRYVCGAEHQRGPRVRYIRNARVANFHRATGVLDMEAVKVGDH